MFLWFGKAGSVRGNERCRSFFRTSLFFCIVDFRSVNLSSEDFFVRVTCSAKAFLEVVDVLIERYKKSIDNRMNGTSNVLNVIKITRAISYGFIRLSAIFHVFLFHPSSL